MTDNEYIEFHHKKIDRLEQDLRLAQQQRGSSARLAEIEKAIAEIDEYLAQEIKGHLHFNILSTDQERQERIDGFQRYRAQYVEMQAKRIAARVGGLS